MKFVVKQFINYSVFFGLIFVINSCAHFRIINLEKNNYQTKDFYQLLSKEYLDLAKYELYEMHDEIDANLFAYKSLLSIHASYNLIGNFPPPAIMQIIFIILNIANSSRTMIENKIYHIINFINIIFLFFYFFSIFN